MKIETAIEIKERTGEAFLNTDPDDIDEAERLSIEALKRVQGQRMPNASTIFHPLPGETEE